MREWKHFENVPKDLMLFFQKVIRPGFMTACKFLLRALREFISNHVFKPKFLGYCPFVLIAAVMWCMNELNGKYTATIDFPAQYINFPNDKILVNKLPENISLRLQGSGFEILRYKFNSSSDSLIVDLSVDVQHSKVTGGSSFWTLLGHQISKLEEQFPDDISLLTVYPDTIRMVYGDLGKRRINVRPVLNLEYDRQFYPKGEPVSNPAQITVSGPLPILDTLKFIETEPYSERRVSDNINVELGLVSISELLTYSADKVSVSLPVERYTEAKLEVPIQVVNVPKGLTVRLFPGKVSLSCMVSASNYSKVVPNVFKAVVDYEKILSSDSKKAKVEISTSPAFVQQVSFTPQGVEYLIEK